MAPPPARRPDAPAGLRRRLALARWALLCEELLERLWRGASLLALFAGLALMGLWAWLPGLLHVALLAAFAAAFALLLWRDLAGLAWPSEAAARRRLERASGLAHRPLLALRDAFGGDPRDGTGRALFALHRRRVAAGLGRLRVGRPLPRLAERDRFALRHLAALVLAAGLMAGWGQARAHLAALLEPDFSGGFMAGEAGQLTLWIAPPAYTGVPPLWLDALAGGGEAVAVPAGSELVAHVRGGGRTPSLAIGDERFAFEGAGDGSFRIAHGIGSEGTTRVAIVQAGRELFARPLEVVPDAPPFVTLSEEPSETLRTGLRLDVVARDDYGLDSLRAAIRLADGDDGHVLELAAPLVQKGAREVAAPVFFNLMAHPWAGMEVRLTMTATDVTGQTARSGEYSFKLPERYFTHPVARRLGEQRKRYVRDAEAADETALVLEALSRDPPAYLGDVGVHLALVAGAARIRHDRDDEAAREAVVGLMWEAALEVEEGPLAFAERRVRALQDELLAALSEGASEGEIERLLGELRLAMEDYMRALASRLRTDPGELFDPSDALKAAGSRELTDLVDQIGELLRAGSRDQAQTLLNRLQEIMENISVGNLSDLAGTMGPQAAEVIHTVRQLMTEQQELLDETFRILRDAAAGAYATDPQAAVQARLRDVLEGLMGRMEELGFATPRAFPRAGRSMGRAVRQLAADRPGQAVDHQSEAIEYLRTGAGALLEEMLERAGQEATGEGASFFAAPRDPMGRQLGSDGNTDTGAIRLPDRGAIVRAREILEELYRRAGEWQRPAEERDYLRRLLRRF